MPSGIPKNGINKGRFKKGQKPTAGAFKKGHKNYGGQFEKGNKLWNNPNNEKTRFKYGVNHIYWKGGISKTNEYRQEGKRKRRIIKLGNGGYHSLIEWETLKAQYNWTCLCCKKKEPKIKLTRDHIIPLSKGGSDNIENIQPLCQSCNSFKYIKIIKYI